MNLLGNAQCSGKQHFSELNEGNGLSTERRKNARCSSALPHLWAFPPASFLASAAPSRLPSTP